MTDAAARAEAAARMCENCKWWDNSTELVSAQPGTTGACRVRPPVADDRNGQARWPYTEDVDWCGSFHRGAAADGAAP